MDVEQDAEDAQAVGAQGRGVQSGLRRSPVVRPGSGWILTSREWAMLREGATAYIEHYTRDEWELYDLESDPHQR